MKGGDKIVLNGYTYGKRNTNRGERLQWRCVLKDSKTYTHGNDCIAKIYVSPNSWSEDGQNIHAHHPEYDVIPDPDVAEEEHEIPRQK